MRSVPRTLPPLSYLLDDIAHNEKAICYYLQISLGQLQRWKKHDQAPRAYMLALFFVSKWGRSHVSCDAETAARHWASMAGRLDEALTRTRNKHADVFWHGVKWASLGQIPLSQVIGKTDDSTPDQNSMPTRKKTGLSSCVRRRI